jgi:membrane fusion protein (multidrug efflux system)
MAQGRRTWPSASRYSRRNPLDLEMTGKSKTLVALVALAAAAGLAWWLQQSPAGSPEASKPGSSPAASGVPARGGPTAVEVGQARHMRIVDAAEAVGTVQSRREVVLRPEVSGRVMRVAFADGQRIAQGQLMVQLDDTLQRAQLQQAQAQAAIARTQQQRNQDLLKQGFVTQNAVDQSTAALEVAQAQVALAEAQLARLRVVAPFAGRAGIRQVQVGDYVKDGVELVTLTDAAEVWVDYRLPERYMARVRTGLPVSITLDSLPGRSFEGRVHAIESRVDADGRALLVRARLENRDGLLRSGLFARTSTTFGVREQALVVPEEAVVPDGGQQYVWRIADAEKGPVAERVVAVPGLRLNGQVELVGASLQPGDRVVTAGQDRLLNGNRSPVRIVQVGASGAGPQAALAASAPASATSATP